jgi:hypothetical protein
MAKQLHLNIPTPCHEDWDAMTPVDKGKFCGSCQKQVVDFTSMSDRQVAEFFKKPSTGSVCGRFMTDQLGRSIEIPKKRIPWVKYFFQVALPAFLFSAKAIAQKPAKTKQTVSAKPSTKIACTFPDIIGDVVVLPIKGELKDLRIKDITKAKVINETGEVVPYASIETEKSRIKMMADSNGVFELDKSLLVKEENILVSSVGFEITSIPTGSNPYEMNDEIYVHMTTKSLMPAVFVTAYGNVKGRIVMGYSISTCTKSTLSQKIDSVTSTVIKPLTSINKLKVYPNPVESGSAINISISELEEGYYSFQLLNLSGQLVNKREIWIDSDARLLNFDLPAVADGSYFIILTNRKTGRKFSEKIIVQ